MLHPLQPIRIPVGWTVSYNDFREVNPSSEAVEADLLREDLLQLTLDHPERIVDLGWYGSADDGAFGVVCVEPDFRGKTLASIRTRDRETAVAAVEEFLEQYGRGRSATATR